MYVGILVGWWMAHSAPLLTVTGRWIWVLPVAALIEDLGTRPTRLVEYLYESKAEGIGALIAVSTLAITGYSIGMALWRLKQHWAKSGSVSVTERLVAISSVAVIVLCVLALVLQSYEIRTSALERLAACVKTRPILPARRSAAGSDRSTAWSVFPERRSAKAACGGWRNPLRPCAGPD